MNVFHKVADAGKTLKGVVILAVLVAVLVGGYFAYTGIMGVVGKVAEVGEDTGNFLSGRPTVHGAALGESCNVGADCRGFRSALASEGGVACCRNRCTETKKDWANVWYCPHECRSGAFAAAGTC